MISIRILLTLTLLAFLAPPYPASYLPRRQLLPPPTISCEACNKATGIKACHKCTMMPYRCVGTPMPVPCDVDIEGGAPFPGSEWPGTVPDKPSPPADPATWPLLPSSSTTTKVTTAATSTAIAPAAATSSVQTPPIAAGSGTLLDGGGAVSGTPEKPQPAAWEAPVD